MLRSRVGSKRFILKEYVGTLNQVWYRVYIEQTSSTMADEVKSMTHSCL